MRQIRVLVVEDSMVFRELLVQALNKDPAITVVATAKDPFEARDAIITYKPDVMTLDIELPKMSGLEFMKKLMPQYPLPVVVISSLSDKVFDAMNAGAVDFVAKPQMTDRQQLSVLLNNELPIKIKIASMARIGSIKSSIGNADLKKTVTKKDGVSLIAMGASTGGTEALTTVIKEFRPDIPGTVVVQHMPAGFTGMFANRLNDVSRVVVKEAQNGDKIVQGQVLIAPGGDAQMRVKRVGEELVVEIKKGPKVSGHCPSVDVLFDSVATAAADSAIGIILTGMGGDGAKGLLSMRKAGAVTIGQDESTCVVYGMPKVAYDMGAVQYQDKLEDIAKRTYSVLGKAK